MNISEKHCLPGAYVKARCLQAEILQSRSKSIEKLREFIWIPECNIF
jgi:hypothetical protein